MTDTINVSDKYLVVLNQSSSVGIYHTEVCSFQRKSFHAKKHSVVVTTQHDLFLTLQCFRRTSKVDVGGALSRDATLSTGECCASRRTTLATSFACTRTRRRSSRRRHGHPAHHVCRVQKEIFHHLNNRTHKKTLCKQSLKCRLQHCQNSSFKANILKGHHVHSLVLKCHIADCPRRCPPEHIWRIQLTQRLHIQGCAIVFRSRGIVMSLVCKRHHVLRASSLGQEGWTRRRGTGDIWLHHCSMAHQSGMLMNAREPSLASAGR